MKSLLPPRIVLLSAFALHAEALMTSFGSVRRRPADAHAPRPSLTRMLLVGTDTLAIAVSMVLVAQGVSLGVLADNSLLPAWAWSIGAMSLVGFALADLYPGAGSGAVEELRRVVLVSVSVHVLGYCALFLAGALPLAASFAFATSCLLVAALVLSGRAGLRHAFSARGWWGVPIAIVGAGRMGRSVAQAIRSNPGLGFKVVGWFDDDVTQDELDGIPVLGTIADIDTCARRLGVKRALITIPTVAGHTFTRLLRGHGSQFQQVFMVPSTVRPGLERNRLGGVFALRAPRHVVLGLGRVLKRTMDLLLLVPATIVAVPLVVLGMIAIMIVSPGNPFYAQRREGLGGRAIAVWKLRTMYPDAEALLERHLAANPAAREEWSRAFKLTDDPRILPWVGGILRRASIDELPQLCNIAKGEMSFVGPRPFPEYHVEQFDESFRTLRRSVVPGLTGLWQVSTRSDGELAVQEALDSYYVRNWSVWLDLYLLGRTPIAVITSRGAR